MFKRLFFTVVGLGAGVALGVYAVQKVESAQRALRPEAIAHRAGERASGVGARISGAVQAGKAAAAAREAELRSTYGKRDVP